MNGNALLKGAGASVGLVMTAPALADTGQADAWGHHGMMWNGGIHWIIGPIMMVLFLIGAAAVVALVIRWLGATPHSPESSGSSAHRMLEERFARGELDEEEFRQRKKTLEE